MDVNDSKFLLSHFYVAKQLKKNPANAIKFIMINRDHFKFVTDEWLVQIKKEHSVTDEQLDAIKVDKLTS